MTNQLDNLIGQSFGLLTVIERAPNDEKGRASLRGGRVYLLKEEKKKLVGRYRQGGLSHHALAEEFGVSLSTVRRTLRRASNGGK